MTVPIAVASGETLGRGVFSGRHRDRARRGSVPQSVFLERRGVTEISVDRLDRMPPVAAVRVAENVGAARGRRFRGWATVEADRAGADGRTVRATPKEDNECHADIVLPPSVGEDWNRQKYHAKRLADMAKWRERPDEPPAKRSDAR